MLNAEKSNILDLDSTDPNEDYSNDFSVIKPINKDLNNTYTDATENKNNPVIITNINVIKKNKF